MSTEEAYVKVHGDIETLRDGDQTHQNIQTNLADIISGGTLNKYKISDLIDLILSDYLLFWNKTNDYFTITMTLPHFIFVVFIK